ncbi:hypothetical protein D9619_008989 [Psilocybe cf. subviscida]|uniref:Protein kinase domain-containing protein n=1 Tax=Psilocybe cf. subviscida TaxID=2480587 RepID=A0A8H5BWN1_9AGAR|nr:hypothetical protein D9619_008989 [Psilocybe cf. subviscida]
MTLSARRAKYLEKKYAFRPIPHSYPFDPRVPAVIDSVRGDQPIFVLCKNRQEIVVEGPFTTDLLPILDPEDEFFKYHWIIATLKYSVHVLEIIQGLIEDIEFGEETKRVFLIKDSRTGQYRLSQPKSLGLVRVSCPLWATIIPVEEIIFTVFCPLSERRGIWKGKEVDVMYAWNRQDQKFMNNAMLGYRSVQRGNLDLTFEVYGHAVAKDGAVVGLVSEAAWGRMVQPSDRALIYSAMAQLQALGCIYKAVRENRFLIADGKVRLLDLHLISWFDDRQKLDKLAEEFHWDAAETLFHDLETYGPYGHQEYLCPLARFYLGHEDISLIPPGPRMGRNGEMVYSLLVWPAFFSTSWVEPWNGYQVVEPDSDDEPVSSAVLQARRPEFGPIRRQPHRRREQVPREDNNVRESRAAGPSSTVTRSARHPYNISIAIRNYHRAMERAGPYALSGNTDATASIEELE